MELKLYSINEGLRFHNLETCDFRVRGEMKILKDASEMGVKPSEVDRIRKNRKFLHKMYHRLERMDEEEAEIALADYSPAEQIAYREFKLKIDTLENDGRLVVVR